MINIWFVFQAHDIAQDFEGNVITIEGQKKDSVIFIDLVNGYAYRKRSDDATRIYLCCKQRGCSARASVNRHGPMELVDGRGFGHVHNPDPTIFRARMLRAMLYHRAQTETKDLKSIYDEEIQKYIRV